MTFSMAVMCGNRLKRWKTMPILRALPGDVPGLHLVQDVASLPVAHELAADPQTAGVDLLEVVDAAQERRLATARRPQQHERLLRIDLEVDALEHVELAERLPDLLGLDHRLRRVDGLRELGSDGRQTACVARHGGPPSLSARFSAASVSFWPKPLPK